jgi:hypothetical protein
MTCQRVDFGGCGPRFEPATVPTNGSGRHLVTCEAVTRRSDKSTGGEEAVVANAESHVTTELLVDYEAGGSPRTRLSSPRRSTRSLAHPLRLGYDSSDTEPC